MVDVVKFDEQGAHGLYNLTADEGEKLLVANKQTWGYTWQDIADIMLHVYDILHSESYYRKAHKTEMCESGVSNIDDKLIELRKERVKLSDERTQTNANIRRLAREDTLKEIAREAVAALSGKKLLSDHRSNCTSRCLEDNVRAALLCISDWHYGIEIDNPFNKYNTKIARERVSKLRDQVIKYCRENNIKTIHVLNLGDMIAGRIHLTIRLQSRIDVITQIMEVSEILAEFLSDLCNAGFMIKYQSCSDNHSRIEPIKTDSLDLESLCRITDWYLQERLSTPYIEFIKNRFGDDIITGEICGHPYVGVHGDKDKPGTVIEKITLYTRRNYDLAVAAHLHHFSADEHTGTVIVSNGSVMGCDDYSANLRLHSRPSQNLIISSTDNVIEAIYRITL